MKLSPPLCLLSDVLRFVKAAVWQSGCVIALLLCSTQACLFREYPSLLFPEFPLCVRRLMVICSVIYCRGSLPSTGPGTSLSAEAFACISPWLQLGVF